MPYWSAPTFVANEASYVAPPAASAALAFGGVDCPCDTGEYPVERATALIRTSMDVRMRGLRVDLRDRLNGMRGSPQYRAWLHDAVQSGFGRASGRPHFIAAGERI